MGFFSWLTADTAESIPNVHSGRQNRVVYLLQPNGKPPIAEPGYDGYGIFGGTAGYEWLAEANLPASSLKGLNVNHFYVLGIELALGRWYHHAATGLNYTIFDRFSPEVLEHFKDQIDPAPIHLGVKFDEPVDVFDGQSANEMRASGALVERGLTLPYPLKFSFDRDAVYEDFGASLNDPAQGFFYDD